MAHDHHQGRHPHLLQGLGPQGRQPIVFSHGWPLTADTADAQLVFFANQKLPHHRP